MATLVSLCATAQDGQHSGINFNNLNTSVKPGNDFYQFATGHWIDNNPQNPEYSRWGAFTKLDDDNKKQLKEMFAELTDGTHELDADGQKVADLYNLSMDSVRRNALGASPLKPYLDEINAVKTRKEFIALCNKNHDNLLFHIFLGADEKNAKMNIVSIYQGGLSLRDERYYLEDTPDNKRILAAHKEYVTTVLKLAGYGEEEAEQAYATVFAIEKEMATVTVSRVELRNPEKNYNKLMMDELNKTLDYDMSAYIAAYGYEGVDSVNVGQIVPVQKACKLLSTLPVEDLKTLYRVRMICGATGLLSDAFLEAKHKFDCALQGKTEMQPRWKRAIGMVNGVMGEAVGKMYVQKYFPAAAKERMLAMVENLRKSLGERIDAQEWMSAETKAVAHDKLDAFIVKIGYPDKWQDMSQLVIDPKKNLYDNMQVASEFFFNLDKKKHLGKPVDNTEWFMSAHTVNAYYNPTTNEICFPAGILQPPFFSMEADDATNLGAIGVVIGHEMTHGFDDQGRQFDKEGNLRQWWKEADVEAFKKPAEALTEYFNTLEILPAKGEEPALLANGKQCLGENIADHGGVMIAYNALQKVLASNPIPVENGFTANQRFFLSYANVWAGIASEEVLRYLTMVDVHSVARLRVNGTLPHINEWYEAFGVKEGDSLYIPEEQRVKIW